MKKILLFAVALALPLLYSCNKDKNNDPGSSSIATGESFSTAATFENEDMWASFNGDNTFTAGIKAKAEYNVIWGTYSYENKIYTLYPVSKGVTPYGTIEDLGNGKVKVNISGMTDQVIEVTVTKPSAGNDNQRAANHTWKFSSLTLVYGGATYNCADGDLNKFEQWAVEQKLIEKKTFKDNMVIAGVFVSDSKLGIAFANDEKYVATFDSKADLASFALNQVAIKGSVGDLSFFEGQASIAFTWSKCVISITGKANGKNTSVILTLAL